MIHAEEARAREIAKTAKREKLLQKDDRSRGGARPLRRRA